MNIVPYILLAYIVCTTRCTTNITEEVNQQQIDELEKEKNKIYTQISLAIDDTIKTLETSNDSDARAGLTYMKELKTQISEFNATDLALENEAVYNSSEEISNLINLNGTTDNSTDFLKSGRRKSMHKKEKPVITGYEKIKSAILNFGDLHKMGMSGKIVSKKKQARLENRIALQKKLDSWMAQREAEKRKIREYKARLQVVRSSVIVESCPDFGEDKGKKKGTNKLPCCRKCCKKSYMGCLK